MSLPAAIIFVNDVLYSDGYYDTQTSLSTQLYVSEVMTGVEFDARVTSDPNYPDVVHLSGRRILVKRSFNDLTNRNLADIAIYVKHGLAAIEINKIGPPNTTYRVDDLTIYDLIRG